MNPRKMKHTNQTNTEELEKDVMVFPPKSTIPRVSWMKQELILLFNLVQNTEKVNTLQIIHVKLVKGVFKTDRLNTLEIHYFINKI